MKYHFAAPISRFQCLLEGSMSVMLNPYILNSLDAASILYHKNRSTGRARTSDVFLHGSSSTYVGFQEDEILDFI